MVQQEILLNASVDERDQVRLSKQCTALLWRLRKSTLTNVDAAVGFYGKDGKLVRVLNLTARISELRQAGHDIPAPTRGEAGLFTYRLVTP